MASPWQSLGYLPPQARGWHGWGTSHRLTAKQQRDSESGFHQPQSLLENGAWFCLEPQPKLAKMWITLGTRGAHPQLSPEAPTSVTAWQPAPTTGRSRTNQSVCFAVRVARVWQTGGTLKNLDPHIGDYSAASDSHRQSDGSLGKVVVLRSCSVNSCRS